MRIAFDTNILYYVEADRTDPRHPVACKIIEQLPPAQGVIPAQVLGELFRILVRKHRQAPGEAAAIVRSWQDAYDVVPTTSETIGHALRLTTQHHVSIWDAVIIAASADAGCDLLLTEDMHHGFTWSGLTIVDPFLNPPDPLLAALLDDTG